MPKIDKDPAVGTSMQLSDSSPITSKMVGGNVLRHTNNHTVQPVALMRLGLFVPTLKTTDRAKRLTKTTIDATEELIQLKISQAEGYENVTITGTRLDMDSDFKTWIGVVRSIAEYGNSDGMVEMSITELAKLCGFPSTEVRTRLRKRITDSLQRIMSVVIHLQMKTDKEKDESDGLMLHLIKDVQYSDKKNFVTFSADPRLSELYEVDHTVLLHLKVIKTLPRKESAQAIYTFIESLPKRPAPISIKRLRDRLNLRSAAIGDQNRTVRKAMEVLRDIGYVEYEEVKKGRSSYFRILRRNPKLILDSIPDDEPGGDSRDSASKPMSEKQKALFDAVSSIDESDLEKVLQALTALKKK
ncbi:RepB family plasmid replication initiator protein [Lelliottia wanjuensis]|uniref:RepB family plasmid replication initiator protein n=1 Tax=Lelliottia wanjuensis TaxID=3050585 RepID=UPI00254A6447|nr:RepB family plasmid replication initiator protein [Lelliottia sp. V104_15]MDK9604597.1 RepB family plasmid replication initiator protein [Lelliottia sp. V104_15]